MGLVADGLPTPRGRTRLRSRPRAASAGQRRVVNFIPPILYTSSESCLFPDAMKLFLTLEVFATANVRSSGNEDQ